MNKKAFSRFGFIGFCFFLLLSTSASLWAQIQAGRIVGIVTDPSQGVIAGASVTVTDVATNRVYTSTTNEAGEYAVTPLQPAVYRISVGLVGFQTAVRDGIEVLVGQAVRVDVRLEVGDANTKIEVTAAAPMVDTESGSLGQVISNRLVNDLPLNGRGFWDLVRLSTGSAELPNTNAVANSIRPNYISGMTISGVTGVQVGFINDGMDVSDNLGGTAVEISIDAIQEFKVQENAYSAEYSRPALFNLTTKSGANRVSGSLFDFLRNDKLDSRNFFSATRAILKQNQFGGTLGAPLVIPHVYNGKDRTFVFLSYEATRASQGVVANDIVPTPGMLGGNFSAAGQPAIYDPLTTAPAPSGAGTIRSPFPGNQIGQSRMSPQALFFDKFLPAPNLTATTASFAPAQHLGEDQFTIRGDHSITDRTRAFVRWSRFDNRLDSPNVYPALGIAPLHAGAENVAASLTSTLSASRVNELHFDYLLATLTNTPFLQGTDFNQQAGIQDFQQLLRPSSGGSFPDFAWSGYTSMQGSAFDQRPKTQNRQQYQIADYMTMIQGRHILKFGVDFHRLIALFSDSREYMGSWTFTGINTQNPANTSGTGSSIADWDLGLPATGQRAYWAKDFGGIANYWHFFIQDDLKVTSRLTLNLGLRYEYSPWQSGYEGQLGTFDGTSTHPLIISSSSGQINLDAQPSAPIAYGLFGNLMQTSQQAGLPPSISYTDKHQFAPRFGFAWRPFGEKTVIRGGFGIFYQPEGANNRPNINMLPYLLDETLSNTANTLPNRTLADFFLGKQIGSAGVIPTIKPTYTHLRMGLDQHWNLGVQRSLTAGSVVEVNYAGDRGAHLNSTNYFNLPPPAPGTAQSRSPYPWIGDTSVYFSQDMSSIYHSLQAKAERRSNKGFWSLVSYTFSKNILHQATPQVGGNTAWERELASFDITNALAVSAGYALPFGRGKHFLSSANRVADAFLGGWQTQGVLTARSGRPFTPTISRDVANIGITSQRPNRLCSGNLADPTVSQWFNLSCFAAPAAYTFGNSGGNIMREGWLRQLDFSLFKEFTVREHSRLQFRSEFFNLTNTPSFLAPSGVIDAATGATVTATSNSPRQIQLALKFVF